MGKDLNIDLTLEEHIKLQKKSNPNKQGRGRGRGGKFQKRGGKRQPIANRRITKGKQYQPNKPKSKKNFKNSRKVIRKTGFNNHKQVKNFKRLIVENLPTDVTNDEIYNLFQKYGPMNICKIKYDKLGKSFGKAIVEYKDEEHAKKAMRIYRGAEINGEIIKISYDRRTGIHFDGIKTRVRLWRDVHKSKDKRKRNRQIVNKRGRGRGRGGRK